MYVAAALLYGFSIKGLMWAMFLGSVTLGFILLACVEHLPGFLTADELKNIAIVVCITGLVAGVSRIAMGTIYKDPLGWTQ
jgi:hypothetical protein